ncbi:MAG: TonB-dependent receptor, partial [Caulobacterales bacterium]|nr:TonB-dependent receptor [Caulobacterales bacterium]
QVLFNEQGQVISTAFIAAKASIESVGFEIETSYALTDNLKLTAGFGYTDAEYRDFQFSATENLSGLPVKLVPEYDGNVAARYETGAGLFVRGEVSLTGETPLDERSLAVRDAAAVVNLQAGYEGEKYALRVFAENVTNERLESGLAFGNFSGDDGIFYAPLDAPRIIGVEGEYRF